MNRPADNFERRERAIAGLLWYGTWLAAIIIAAGLALELLQRLARPLLHNFGGLELVKAGVALFILLPVARVALMIAIFLRERDYAYTAISTLVLVIIAVSFWVGL
jgi:uncharacterized membrane protein